MTYLWIGLIIVAVVGIAISTWLTRPRLKCPNCGSHSVNEIKREQKDLRSYEFPGGGGGGGGTMVQLVYDVTYRCSQCNETWRKTITESE